MFKVTALLLLVISTFGTLQGRDSISATIPAELVECYKNPYLLVKDNLLPMTMPVLIDIIRKVEAYQGINMDMRTLSTTLLQRFRLDGIERDPEVLANAFVIPYKPSGAEFYKYRFLMNNLIPNQRYTFPNASLNMIEQCTLHWMLSSSVDRWQRGDEGSVCNSRLTNYPDLNSRIRRQAQSPPRTPDPDAEIIISSAIKNEMSKKPDELEGYQSYQAYPRGMSVLDSTLSACPIENGVVFSKYGAVKAGVLIAGVAAGLQPQSVSQKSLVQARAGSLSQRQSYGQPGGGGYPQSGGGYPQSGGGYPQSGGGYPQSGGAPRGWPTDSDYPVSNKWAATLSGELAEVAILQGPAYGQAMRIGLSGGWNNTQVPRYYFLSEPNKDALTESDIRASIDGLMFANSIIEWNRLASGGLKLSQLLEMYYSEVGVFDINAKACKRKERYTQIIPQNDLQREVEAFAQVLQYEQPSAVNLESPAISEFTRIAVSKLPSAVSSMVEPMCADARQSGPIVSPAADLYLVIDCIWDFLNIQGVLSSIIEKCDVSPYGSRVTLFNGKDGSILVNTTDHIIQFHQNFNFTSYNTYTRGWDMARTLQEMQQKIEIEMNIQRQSTSRYQQNKYYDNRNNYDNYQPYNRLSSFGTNTPSNLPKVVVFIPSTNAGPGGDGDNSYIRNKIYYYKTSLPDVKLLYLVSGSKDRYSQYADDPNKDIFTLTISNSGPSSITPLAARIAEVPRPIVNPTCGSSYIGRWYSAITTNGYLLPNSIHYYRIHPNYFYKSTDVRIRIQSQSSVTLTVCQSRNNPLPNGNRTVGGSGDVTCKQVSSDTYELRIGEGSCGDRYAYQCQPYYISITAPQSQSGSSNANCREEECRYPNMIKYTISHEGLSCYSGVIKIISSPFLIITLVFISIKDYF